MKNNILEINNIHKSFGSIQAVKDVSLSIQPGTVRGIIGENGAGKSTIVKMLAGIHSPDKGSIIFDGKDISSLTPKESEEIGIRVVHQEIPVCYNLSVAENIFLQPVPPCKGVFIDRKHMVEMSKIILQKINIDLDPRTLVADCTPAQKQLMLIAKALAEKALLVVLDEPTSSLAAEEVEILYNVVETLKAEGTSFIFISHRLNEVIDFCDNVTVMKNGTHVTTLEKDTDNITVEKMTDLMIGHEVDDYYESKLTKENRVCSMSVKNLNHEATKLHDVNFELYKGEILGIAGLLGAGKTELMDCLFGLNEIDSGEISLDGEVIENSSPLQAVQNKFGYLTEDRRDALFYEHSIWFNSSTVIVDIMQKASFLLQKLCETKAIEIGKELKLKASSIHATSASLSGGNQQKVLLGRWLLSNPKVLLLDEPTRGVDVGAKMEIRSIIRKLTEQGMSVIYVSLDAEELVHVSDRILVMASGTVVKELEGSELKIANVINNMNKAEALTKEI